MDNEYIEVLEALLQENEKLNNQVAQLTATNNEICKTISELANHVFGLETDNINNKLELKRLINRVENMPYEVRDHRADSNYAIPKIMAEEATIDEIVNNRKSIARFGDGEFGLMFGNARWRFQGNNELLAKRLREVVTSKDNNIIIGLNNFYGDLSHRTPKDADGIRTYITPTVRAEHMSLLDTERVYGHACISRNTDWEHVKMQRRLWDNKECVFIEGEETRMGVGNDLFNNAASIERILCPSENAFDVYDDILAEALKLSKSKTILIALGPTASVLAYDLAKAGYHAIDIGHADLSYEWLVRNNGEKTAVATKYNNEYEGGYQVENIVDHDYEAQIIARVTGR
ncbi:MAG: DUF1792 domain-containing protein [Lachnospiraceae bacterium]|nr:DUF1792 domain-containing protein [Candidatus Colinaster scatohippi]